MHRHGKASTGRLDLFTADDTGQGKINVFLHKPQFIKSLAFFYSGRGNTHDRLFCLGPRQLP